MANKKENSSSSSEKHSKETMYQRLKRLSKEFQQQTGTPMFSWSEAIISENTKKDMEEETLIYLVLLQTTNVEKCIDVLCKYSEYHKLGYNILAYVNDSRNGSNKATKDVRDEVLNRLQDDDVFVMVVECNNAAWYMSKEDSSWLKQYI